MSIHRVIRECKQYRRCYLRWPGRETEATNPKTSRRSRQVCTPSTTRKRPRATLAPFVGSKTCKYESTKRVSAPAAVPMWYASSACCRNAAGSPSACSARRPQAVPSGCSVNRQASASQSLTETLLTGDRNREKSAHQTPDRASNPARKRRGHRSRSAPIAGSRLSLLRRNTWSVPISRRPAPPPISACAAFDCRRQIVGIAAPRNALEQRTRIRAKPGMEFESLIRAANFRSR